MHETKVETEVKENEENCGANNEDILIKSIGRFGRYQFRLFVFVAILCVFEGWCMDEYIFTTAKVNKRCFVPECESNDPDFSPTWILNAIPGSNTSVEQCTRYVRSNITNGNETCSKILFNTDSTEECEQFVYENTNTVVYDFDLGCDEWKRSSLGSIRVIGKALSFSFSGLISDKWGRKVAIAINLVNCAVFGIARFWVNDYYSFATLVFVQAASGSFFLSAYILASEYVGTKYREMSIAIFTSTTCVGHITQLGIVLLVPNWRYYTLTLYSIVAVSLAYIPFIHESIRWLISTEQYDKAEIVISKVAKINRKSLPKDIVLQLQKQKKILEKTKDVKQVKEPWLPVIVWRYKRILINLIIASLWNFTVDFVRSGLTLNSTTISGNSHVNYALVYVVAFIGYFVTIFVTPRFKRRTIVCGGFLICGFCMFSFIFLSEDHINVSLIFFLGGRMLIAIILNTTYIYTLELFPTRYRNSLFAFASLVGQCGGIVAPLTPAIAESVWVNLPYVLYGGFCVLSAALVFLIPETSGKKLPDTIEDVCNTST